MISRIIVSATGIAIGIAWAEDYPPTPAVQGIVQGTYFTDYYVMPWCRYQPYILGMLFGFWLYKYRNMEKLKFNAIVICWCWVRNIVHHNNSLSIIIFQAIAFVVGCLVIYGANSWLVKVADEGLFYDYTNIPIATRSFYNGLHR